VWLGRRAGSAGSSAPHPSATVTETVWAGLEAAGTGRPTSRASTQSFALGLSKRAESSGGLAVRSSPSGSAIGLVALDVDRRRAALA
jgi:hypothetical protein